MMVLQGNSFFFGLEKQLRCYNLYKVMRLQLIQNNKLPPHFMKKQLNTNLQPKRKCSAQSDSSDESECDDSYIPRFMNSRRKRLQIKLVQEQGQNTASFNNSLWKLEQNVAYMTFLRENGQLFQSNWHQRKSLKINVLMSKLVKTRSPAQCRSHHQKMMKYHTTIPNIIDHILDLQRAAPLPKEREEQPQTEQTPTTDIVLQDLSDRWGWVEEYEDLWNKMMDERWLEGADEYYTVG